MKASQHQISFAAASAVLFLICIYSGLPAMAQTPPTAPEGYRWVKNEAFSDEFNGTELDQTKWYDYNPRWKGRVPGKFMPSSISVKDGCLQIKSTLLDPPQGDFTIACGAVQSKSREALFGYYECRMKASSISTSSTFWLTSERPKSVAMGTIGLELDIQECIGNAQRWDSFKKQMKGNTHIKLTPNAKGLEMLEAMAKQEAEAELKAKADGKSGDAEELSEEEKAEKKAKQAAKRLVLAKGGGVDLESNVDAEFHTYGCWWVDGNTMKFYADGEYGFTIEPSTAFDETPFDHPLFMNLICETYGWEVPPTAEDLADDTRNTAYYDWVRSYQLVKIEADESDESASTKN